MIHLNNFTKLWKTKKALEWVEDKELRERILAYYRPKTRKPKKSVTWRDLAHRVFSEYVRLYNCDDKWFCICITCGQKIYWKYIQAWHFITRTNTKYTFDITNVYPQCERCNITFRWNYIQYTIIMTEKLGTTELKKRINDKELVELKQYQYEEMIIEWYKFICDKKHKIWETEM